MNDKLLLYSVSIPSSSVTQTSPSRQVIDFPLSEKPSHMWSSSWHTWHFMPLGGLSVEVEVDVRVEVGVDVGVDVGVGVEVGLEVGVDVELWSLLQIHCSSLLQLGSLQ